MKKYIKKLQKSLINSLDNLIDNIQCLKRFLQITKIYDAREKKAKLRTIFVNRKQPDGYVGPDALDYSNNAIVTSKYTLITFIPKNLYEQFRRIANFYFLINAIIMFIIPDPPFDPFSNATPFIIVILVTAVKQAYEDILRHRADRRVNKKLVKVLRDGKFVEIQSKRILCGDIVEVERDSQFPCDMILIYSKAESETCHIQTANLDGETNLKIRYIPQRLPRLTEDSDFDNFRAVISCEKPNTRLYEFRGKITLENGREIAISNDNILLKGQNLKIAHVIYGIAIYTGKDTKMMLNSKYKANKLSSVERRLNAFVLVFIVLLILLTLICLVGSIYFEDNGIYEKHWYLNGREPAFYNTNRTLTRFITFIFFMNINYLVPLSMYVTVELQRFLGSDFFQSDIEMYDEQANEPAKVNSSDLNEDLGQIEYLFSDKTGTLTENQMVFKNFGIDGVTYEERDGKIYELGAETPTDPMKNDQMTRLLEGLSLCHTVQLDQTSTDDYNASSPDELSFIKFLKLLGIVFEGDQVRKNGDKLYRKISYNVDGYRIEKNYELVEILDFDSSRKRMSVIVRHADTNSYILYTKGADNAMFDKSTEQDHSIFDKLLKQYSTQGWRTLVFGSRVLTSEEFEEYNNALTEARNDVAKREQKMKAVYETIENNLVLSGVTAVEDKLQENVAETLSALREAGIKIWVLTGDKLETAVNISESCKHFSPNMIKFSLSGVQSSIELKETLKNIRIEIKKEPNDSFALVIDGETLGFVFEMNLQDSFIGIAEKCDAVLCCRMSPSQKAEIVKLIKFSKPKPMTAAIGDGANDVSMIQEAHVGIGIFGKEGRSAALSADFAFSKFKFLKRAFLVHGYLYYTRVAALVLYFFYKNFLFVICQFYYAFFNAFSAGSVFNSLYQAIFNLALTTLPIFILGLVEQKVPIEKLKENPQYYRTIAKNSSLSAYEFTKWTLLGVWHSFNCYFVPFFLLYFNNSNLGNNGLNEGGGHLGSLAVFLIFIIAHIKVLLIWQHQTVITYITMILSVILFSLSYFISNTFLSVGPFKVFTEDQNLYWQCYQILSNVQVWFLIFLAVIFALIPDIIIKCFDDMELNQFFNFERVSKFFRKKFRSNNISNNHVDTASDKCRSTPYVSPRDQYEMPTKKKSLDVQLFQTDRSIVSSNNIEIQNTNIDTHMF